MTSQLTDAPVSAPESVPGFKPAAPVAWMNPTLMSFKNMRTNCPPQLMRQLEGIVAWAPETAPDAPVTDRAGVQHAPLPLVYADDARVLADALTLMANQCEQAGFYSPVRQPLVQQAVTLAARIRDPQRPGEPGPVAWMNPLLVSFSGLRTACAPELLVQVEGALGWSPAVHAGGPVSDKGGVQHSPRPLMFAENALAVADGVAFLARRCEEQGLVGLIVQPVVQEALAFGARLAEFLRPHPAPVTPGPAA